MAGVLPRSGCARKPFQSHGEFNRDFAVFFKNMPAETCKMFPICVLAIKLCR